MSRSPWIAGAAALVALATLAGVSMYRGRHADAARFAQTRAHYEALVAQAPAGPPRLLHWTWSETGAAIGAQVFKDLVYDESGEIGRSAAPAAAWRARADWRLRTIAAAMDARRDDDRVEIRPMGGHFYLVTETLQ
jgi:hypothetical protein